MVPATFLLRCPEFTEDGLINKVMSNQRQFCGRKRLSNERHLKKMARLAAKVSRKITSAGITAQYICIYLCSKCSFPKQCIS